MAKTCRTCKSQVPWIRCERHQIWLHRKFMYTAPGESRDCHEPRETPPLVDEFAEVTSAMIDAMTGPWYVYRKMPGTQEVSKEVVRKAGELVARAYVLLSRYQEEVGDA